MTAFGPAYASAYDAIYAEKDYDAECDVVVSMFEHHAGGDVRAVLDLGCGTGGHALRLARRGYDVVGVDLSPEMLARAEAKAAADQRSVRWIEGDVASIDAGAGFDAALMMFAVLGYQHTNAGVMETLRNVRRHLRSGGVFIFDAWHGPGVIADPPRTSACVVDVDGVELTRLARGRMDTRRHICTVDYDLQRYGDRTSDRETHVVRFFFPMELELFLQDAGFELVQLGTIEAPHREPGTRDWNMLAIARAA